MSILKMSNYIPGLRKVLKRMYTVNDPILERNLFGLHFKNPVGLAAGFDKNALYFNELFALGFGFIEVGTITPKAQPGNPKPRMFRLPADNALINRMGFNNNGMEVVVNQLKRRINKAIIGGNLGKNKVTPNSEATKDYEILFNGLYPHVDYFVVNVSSPNTPGLRDLQDKEPLQQLLMTLTQLNQTKVTSKPILLKIAPDLTNDQLDDVVEIVQSTGIQGVIATNTTIDRKNLKTSVNEVERFGNGGLSGDPVKNRSNEVIRYLVQKSGNSIPIIGVGGIRTPQDAIEKFEAGASLIQVYTGFIYEGPAMVKRINKALISYFKDKSSKVS